MTPNQRKNLGDIAASIREGHAQVSESFAVGQIALVTSRSWEQALKGLRVMQAEKLIPDGWIKADTVGVLERLALKSPIRELFSRFDIVPGKTETTLFCGFCRPKSMAPGEMKKIFSLPEF